ncbi:carbohydrate ABC transporter ATP-binding protein, CUT1 family [Tistlia consotensis]|uniref:Carbohydrate ABC transporter ATP-binding protein, CUT1 family n=1 Tax=Tistlia consotensis USBA 355 TaxID=560819 RepID=A0A1Y6CCV2_9PROT|nr:ABC transporter ATP-binding protein [Tistlia consotensis]SMF55187.1 carbohydrate ABC transporter ATP-binding protein, CUT1 family [Tistlia consotensis USBA 355]SNR87864.1 carbohydrate ABC transporter ATP-binding protein, CUT1 family [Tistlia consotensis]
MAEVRLEGVGKRFGETQAIAGLDLTVGDGEFVVLLGPTGAGKTTTLRLVAGLERPDEGRVAIGGQDVTGVAPAERDVCFVFQQYSLYPHYSVYDNLAFPLRAPARRLPAGEIDKRVREVAELLRIGGKLKNRATHLSGGEMQRVAIGRALVRRPAIYLMDEPLSSLDAKLREDLRIELKRIQRDLGATVLYVTHDQLEAMTLADRIGVLAEGRLVQIGTPRAVYERPDSLYVARRLGSPQITVLPAGSLGVTRLPPGTDRIGVRAEDLLLHQPGGLEAEALTVEHLGVETVVLLRVGELQVHALLGGQAPLQAGERTTVAVRPGAALAFDAEGRRIETRGNDETREAAYGT